MGGEMTAPSSDDKERFEAWWKCHPDLTGMTPREVAQTAWEAAAPLPESQPLSGATPRTDAFWNEHCDPWKMIDFARQLERELAEARAAVSARQAIEEDADYAFAMSVINAHIEQLRNFGADAERHENSDATIYRAQLSAVQRVREGILHPFESAPADTTGAAK